MCLANGNEESIRDVLSGYVSDFFGESEQNTHKNGGAAFENSEKIAKNNDNYYENSRKNNDDFDLSKFGTDLTQKRATASSIPSSEGARKPKESFRCFVAGRKTIPCS